MWEAAAISAGANLLGGFLGRDSQESQRAKNEALQREFAQNAIQWRVADAKKAGIHPLYAMGAPTMSPSVGVQGDPLAASISSMGADIGRAMTAQNNPIEKMSVTQKALEELQLQNMTLRNDYIAAQIQKLRQPGTPPGIGSIPPAPGTLTDIPLDPKPDKRKRLVMGGEEIDQHPGWSPTQNVADEYGDENPVVSWIYGPLKMWKDYVHTYEPIRNVNRANIRTEKDFRAMRPLGGR